MQKEIELSIAPEQYADLDTFRQIIAKKLKTPEKDISFIKILHKSIDARKRNIRVNLNLNIFVNETYSFEYTNKFFYNDVSKKEPVIIVGSGPAGLFAALKLLELGIKPVLFERGKPIEERKRDIVSLESKNIFSEDSNYCFGEGGAGTFSDGKLYTRSKKRGNHYKVIEVFYYFGANENILYENHPHIGSDRLPVIISNIRNKILECGGEVHFNSKVTDFIIRNNCINGVEINNSAKFISDSVILATGHSARDIYYLLDKKNIHLELKSFAMGVRVEHPQELIDSIQYHGKKNEYLPQAAYSLTSQINKRGVYSFCMCPGGQIVASSTHTDEIVVNGMSNSLRNSKFANSGIVAQILQNDFSCYDKYGSLSGIKLQESLEKEAFQQAGNRQYAPAQRLIDFIKNKDSVNLPEYSYKPGLVLSSLFKWLPDFLKNALQNGFIDFGAKMKGFLTNDAIVVGIESRTSSPVRIPRDIETGQHIQIKGLFPCGEGSGYTGGIVSSAVDGEIAAQRCFEWIQSN